MTESDDGSATVDASGMQTAASIFTACETKVNSVFTRLAGQAFSWPAPPPSLIEFKLVAAWTDIPFREGAAL
jgi:hypothetical protein